MKYGVLDHGLDSRDKYEDHFEHEVFLFTKLASEIDVKIHNTLLNLEILEWLLDEVGERHKTWGWDLGISKFYFVREEDKVKFILRWL